MSDDWRKQYEQEWTPTPDDLLLHEIGRRYHEECEAYDRDHCTGPITRHGIMPATHHELGLVNRNAAAVLRRLRSEYPHLTGQEMHRAIADYNR